MTWWSRFSWFFLAVALTCASACAFLIQQYLRGMPMSFVANMVLATLVGLVAPVAAVVAFALLRKSSGGHARFIVYCGVCLLITVLIGVSAR